MSRLSILPTDQLTPEFAELAKQAEAFNIHATVSQVLAHCPDMIQAFFQFYLPWHEEKIVPPVIKELVRLKVAQLNSCFT